jgi:hypothetical protein
MAQSNAQNNMLGTLYAEMNMGSPVNLLGILVTISNITNLRESVGLVGPRRIGRGVVW